MKSAKTTTVGIAIILTSIASIVRAVSEYGWGELASMDWSVHVTQIATGIGLIFAKDEKKTITPEAPSVSPPSTTPTT